MEALRARPARGRGALAPLRIGEHDAAVRGDEHVRRLEIVVAKVGVVERAQAIRDVKNLQYTYAQYAQYGLWEDMSGLFAKAGVLDTGTEQLEGPKAIAAFQRILDKAGAKYS